MGASSLRPRWRLLAAWLILLSFTLVRANLVLAQTSEGGGGFNGPHAVEPDVPNDSALSPPADLQNGTADQLPPIPQVRINQPIAGSLLVAPPFGNAPLQVGFFALATDPDNIGFLTYQWNFGDGTVSSLPPELYIFHTYTNPGNYVCTLIVKTVDGRSATFFQGVIVRAAPS